MGAKYVVNSSSESDATIAFDPIGGGKLTNDILNCMEVVAARDIKEHIIYGTAIFKQVYIYGDLNRGPISLNRNFGVAWAVSGFLLFNILGKLCTEKVVKMRQRIAVEIISTLASNYTLEVSLAEVLKLKSITAYTKQSTGEKYLIRPQS